MNLINVITNLPNKNSPNGHKSNLSKLIPKLNSSDEIHDLDQSQRVVGYFLLSQWFYMQQFIAEVALCYIFLHISTVLFIIYIQI